MVEAGHSDDLRTFDGDGSVGKAQAWHRPDATERVARGMGLQGSAKRMQQAF
jgi:hypothetical protein